MADPLLTSLCAVCHVSAPAYKCPRCDIRTCSLGCVKKHKARSDCTGERDPTVYLPRSKLRTAAGVDHDYNFLHGIELAAERAERVLVGDRGIVQTEELRPLTVQEVRWKPGRDGRKRKVLVTRVLREAKGRTFERSLSSRLMRLNVVVVCAPLGMSRQRENQTTLNRRTGRINWQVEWLAFETRRGGEEEEDEDGDGDGDGDGDKPKATRALSKVMDDVPLYQAYHGLLDDQARAQGRLPRRTTTRASAPDPSDARWQPASDSLQDPLTSTWVSLQAASIDMWPAAKERKQRRQFQFFLGKPQARSDLPTTMTRLKPEDCFRAILANTRVLEFPTIYVLKAGEAVPSGFALGPKDTAPPRHPPQGTKRKGRPQSGKQTVRSSKRRRPDGEGDGEEGEVSCDRGEADDPDPDGENHDEDGGPKGSVVLEAGEVIAEQSLDEEDDDTTTSSGSDSE